MVPHWLTPERRLLRAGTANRKQPSRWVWGIVKEAFIGAISAL